MGTMLQVRLRGRQAVLRDVHPATRALPQRTRNGDIHIHDLDFYTPDHHLLPDRPARRCSRAASPPATAILREPNDIRSYAALACIAIQANQNDQHGGQSIAEFRLRPWPPASRKTFRKRLPSEPGQGPGAADASLDRRGRRPGSRTAAAHGGERDCPPPAEATRPMTARPS